MKEIDDAPDDGRVKVMEKRKEVLISKVLVVLDQ